MHPNVRVMIMHVNVAWSSIAIASCNIYMSAPCDHVHVYKRTRV